MMKRNRRNPYLKHTMTYIWKNHKKSHMGQNFPKLLGSKYLCHLLSHCFIYQELKMVQEAFVWNNKIYVNPFWHKIEAKAVSQKLQALLLRHLLFSPFRSVYLLLPPKPPQKRAMVKTPTMNSKRNCLSYQTTQFLKILSNWLCVSNSAHFLYNSHIIIVY